MNKHHWKPWVNCHRRRWHLSVPGSGRDGRGRALARCGALVILGWENAVESG